MNNTFIFFNTDPDNGRREAIVFRDPVELITCNSAAEVDDCFRRLDKALSRGLFAAGFLSYELGYHFLEIPFDKRPAFPLFCFGVFEALNKLPVEKLLHSLLKKTDPEGFRILNGHYSVPPDVYYRNIARIKDHMEKGNTYQVNYTFKYKFDLAGSVDAFFAALIKRQEVPYAAFAELDQWAVLSLSPELFFRRDGQETVVRPMKGTMARGKTLPEDDDNSRALAGSVKNRAENIMIVDLLRNDLGKISETGSVRPEELFTVEKYDTLFQMTSTVRSKIKKHMTWHGFFREMFPSGSVTGAPKKRTMEIIKETEEEERNIYTGSIGYISPAGHSLFNVAIRTALLDKKTGKAELGIGSGIVYDSDPVKEYEECLLKGSFLTGMGIGRDFDLIETLLWENGAYFLLDLHLKRLEKSAGYFSYPYVRGSVESSLNNISRSFDKSEKYRIRLLLNKAGNITVSSATLEESPAYPVKAAVSDKRTPKDSVFLRHKTTNRRLYDSELSRYRRAGFFDVLFLNDMGELTEGAVTNVILKKGEGFFTPPLSCGALAGIYREYLLRTGGLPLKEKVLYIEDLKNADELFLVNSVRKMTPAVLAEQPILPFPTCP